MGASESRKRPVLLTFVDWYLPGYKGGGPILSLANMVALLSEHYEFRIVTCDRDLGDSQPYPGIQSDHWGEHGAAKVLYCRPVSLSLTRLPSLLKGVDFDVIYLNGFFSPRFTILPLVLARLGLIRRAPIVLAPRGEFSAGALRLKYRKKSFYLHLARLFRLYDRVLWHASTEYEAEAIRLCAPMDGAKARIHVAPNLAVGVGEARAVPDMRPSSKVPGRADLVFLSRISRMKNLHGALQMLQGIGGQVSFHIYGTLEDSVYWAKCEKQIAGLPPNIEVHYHGAVPHTEVSTVLSRHQFFFLPTQGENFGHVILEALSAGLPVILSDQTPWLGLESLRVGWVLPLAAEGAFRAVIEHCVAMDDGEYESWSRAAREYAESYLADTQALESNRILFLKALMKGRDTIRTASSC